MSLLLLFKPSTEAAPGGTPKTYRRLARVVSYRRPARLTSYRRTSRLTEPGRRPARLVTYRRTSRLTSHRKLARD